MMPAYIIKEPFNYWLALTKNMGVAVFYPFILAVIFTVTNGGEFVDLFYVMLLFSPWILIFVIYVVYRTRVQIVKLDIQDEHIRIHYFKYNRKLVEDRLVSQISFVLRRDKSTLFEYYVLEVKDNGSTLLKQYQYDGWTREKYLDAIDFSENNKIKVDRRVH